MLMSLYQVVGHGLGADVQRQTGQLRRVLELSVEGAEVHGQQVVFGEGRFLRGGRGTRTKEMVVTIMVTLGSLRGSVPDCKILSLFLCLSDVTSGHAHL